MKKGKILDPHKNCPYCGGLHFGQRFDNCTYLNILNDPNLSKAQRANAQSFLDAHAGQRPKARKHGK